MRTVDGDRWMFRCLEGWMIKDSEQGMKTEDRRQSDD